MKNLRILLADDHAIVRTGLSSLLSAKSGFEVVGEASNGIEAVQKAIRLKPDVVIMDLMMPLLDGATATRQILDAMPEAKILILTSFGTANDLARALENGATGAILKSTANEELVENIRGVAEGKRIISQEISQIVAESPVLPELSPRQMQILESITRGFTNDQIALQYGLSLESVKTHIVKLLTKIGASNRAEAVSIALRKHLLKM